MLKLFVTALSIFSVSICFMSTAMAELPELEARQVIVNEDERENGDDYCADLEMVLENKRGKQRIRELRMYRKDYGKDDKTAMFFLSPADVKNTGFLSWNYDEKGKDDEQWLYLPALKKVRRISSSNQDDYFMGSDFTYNDLGDIEIDDYSYAHLEAEVIDRVECYHIERIPNNDDVIEESGYGRTELWVRPDNWIMVKAVYYDKKLKLLKEFTAADIQEIDGIPTVSSMIMDNAQKEHKTFLSYNNIHYNTGVEDEVFSQRQLKKGVK